MKKFFTLALAVAAMAGAVSAQETPKAPLDGKWYRLTIQSANLGANDERIGSCIVLLNETTAAEKTAGKGAQANRLWSSAKVSSDDANFNYQVWKFEKNPDGEGYAMVNKAVEGWVKSAFTAGSNSDGSDARWDYETTGTKDYGFVIELIGETIKIKTSTFTQGMCVAKGGQGFAINAYNGGDGAVTWAFTEVTDGGQIVEPVTEFVPEDGVWYRLLNKYTGNEENRPGRFMSLSDTYQLTTDPSDSQISDKQLWKFVKGDDGTYAIVNKAYPEGQLNSTSTTDRLDTEAQFHYTANKSNLDYGYSFPFVEHNATLTNQDATLAAIRHTSFPATKYFNMAKAQKQFNINLYTTAEGISNHLNALVWEFQPQPKEEVEDPSSITEVKEVKPAAKGIFDLQGRRLSAPVKGINIINGRKVLVK